VASHLHVPGVESVKMMPIASRPLVYSEWAAAEEKEILRLISGVSANVGDGLCYLSAENQRNSAPKSGSISIVRRTQNGRLA
jgi:hypothetical protein